MGCVEDERTIFNLAFIKNKLRNRLGLYVDVTINMFVHDFFTLDDFSYNEAFDKWRHEKDCIGVAFYNTFE